MATSRGVISRRAFLHQSAGAAATIVLAPAVRGTDKAARDNPILGTGDHRYECVHDWLAPPRGLVWGDTHGLAQDAAGNIYVAHTVHPESSLPHAIAVFDEAGAFQSAWGGQFRGGAHGLDLRRERDGEFLYQCNIRRRLVVKTDLRGEEAWQAEYPADSGLYPSREKYCPTNVAFHPGGDIFVADGYGSSFVHRYTSDGGYAGTLIKPGTDKGQVACPHGLWVDERSGTPRLVVADRGNRRIQYFTLDGEHLGFVTAGMRMPCHFKTRGDLLLVPDLESVVTILDRSDNVVVHLGDGHPSGLRNRPRDQFIPGKFIHPHTAIFLRNGDILVAEWVPIGRVTLLRRV